MRMKVSARTIGDSVWMSEPETEPSPSYPKSSSFVHLAPKRCFVASSFKRLFTSFPFSATMYASFSTLKYLLLSGSLRKKKGQKDYDTWCSQVVSNPSTNQARRGLTSLIRREVVLSSWYGHNSFSSFSAAPFWLGDKRRMVCDVKQAHQSGTPSLMPTLFL